MRTSALSLFGIPVVVAAGSITYSARAEPTNQLALELSGARVGLVVARPRSTELVVTTPDIAPALVALVASFTGGKAQKRDIRLSNAALVRKTSEARLWAIRLPALGHGGGTEVELTFTAAPLSTQPVLSAREAAPLPAGRRIEGFRIDVVGIPVGEAPKLDAVTITQRPDGSATTGPLVFEAGAGGGPPFTAWQKSNGGTPAPRNVHIEYVGADGKPILKLDNERCVPTTVLPLGASGTTRITLACGAVRASG